MPYFPEQIMPANIKDESQDVRGNPHVINASDHNKIDEEIRAIETYIGVSSPMYSVGFSGMGCGASSFSAYSGYAYPVPSAASGVGENNIELLESVSDSLATLRDDTIMVTSGVVAIRDPMVPLADGMIPWPTSWSSYMTTLGQDLDDTTTYDEEEMEDLETLQLASVSNLDEVGYVSMINNVYTFTSTRGSVTDDFMAYGFSGTALPTETGTTDERSLLYRQLSMGSNVEVLGYWGVNSGNNTILKVGRKKQGTMSWVHKTGDLVFKGKLFLHVSPIMYLTSEGGFNALDCYVTPAGKIEFRTRMWDDAAEVYLDNATYLYASYQAVLVRTPLLTPRAV